MSDNGANDVLYIVMPAYNEEENIRAVVEDWYTKLEGKNSLSRLVIADSGSTDNTHMILEELKNDHQQLVIMSDTGKMHGPKLMALYSYAINMGADYVFQTDSDGQTLSDEFDPFWDNRAQYDALIGKRLKREDGFSRFVVEKVVCMLLRLFFGVRLEDANAPFRLMTVDSIKKYIDYMPADYNLPNIMLSTYYSASNDKVRFDEIHFKKRQGGKNSINIRKIIVIGMHALRDFYSFRSSVAYVRTYK